MCLFVPQSIYSPPYYITYVITNKLLCGFTCPIVDLPYLLVNLFFSLSGFVCPSVDLPCPLVDLFLPIVAFIIPCPLLDSIDIYLIQNKKHKLTFPFLYHSYNYLFLF